VDPPTINEQVIFFRPSGQLGYGIVLTGLFSDHIPANGDRGRQQLRQYDQSLPPSTLTN
jgi:phage baseplate assembly protein gpV